MASKGTHMLYWNHEQSNGKTSMITIPVSVATVTSSGRGIPTGKLVCNKDEHPLSQQYVCGKCGSKYTIKDIEKRLDEENEVIYPYKEKQDYLKSKASNEITVVAEIPLLEFVKNLEFVKRTYELWTNQSTKTMDVVNKIHKWLTKHQKALVVSYGHKGEEKAGVVVPSADKLLIVEFRDHRTIRPPKQRNLEPLENESKGTFEVLTEDKSPDLYEEYVEKLKSGEKVSIKKASSDTEDLKMESVDFLDD